MKEKILYIFLGIIIGVIITLGVVMLIGKNNPKRNMNGFDRSTVNGGQMPDFDPNNLPEGATTEVLEDGTMKTTIPGGGVIMQKKDGDGGQNAGYYKESTE